MAASTGSIIPAGSGTSCSGRATVDALSLGQRDRIRENLVAELRSLKITLPRTGVVSGTAARPG